MSFYTYTGNLVPGEVTARLILRGGTIVMNLGEYADLTDEEYLDLSPRYNLSPGQGSGVPASTSGRPGLRDLLSAEAIQELKAELAEGLQPGQVIGVDADGNVTGITIGTPGSGGDLHYLHRQDVSSDVWTIHHNMGKNPSILVLDSAGTRIIGAEEYPDLSTTIVRFSAAFSGTADCN